MRKSLISKLWLSLMLAAMLAGAFQAQAPVKADEPSSNTVSASGCVSAGVEAGCLMVTDSKTGTVYNVYFRGRSKPKIGTAIRFTGTPHDGPTICMQGRAVNVRTWVPLKMKCRSQNNRSGRVLI